MVFRYEAGSFVLFTFSSAKAAELILSMSDTHLTFLKVGGKCFIKKVSSRKKFGSYSFFNRGVAG